MNQLTLTSKTPTFTLLSGSPSESVDCEGAYISDLLSWVMGHGQKGQVWITIMSHLNIIAVASLVEFSMVVVTEGAQLDDEVKKKADEENVVIYSTELSSFETAKFLISLGL